jgi:hypothetical protein
MTLWWIQKRFEISWCKVMICVGVCNSCRGWWRRLSWWSCSCVLWGNNGLSFGDEIHYQVWGCMSLILRFNWVNVKLLLLFFETNEKNSLQGDTGTSQARRRSSEAPAQGPTQTRDSKMWNYSKQHELWKAIVTSDFLGFFSL